jgi:hypothetical protein
MGFGLGSGSTASLEQVARSTSATTAAGSPTPASASTWRNT